MTFVTLLSLFSLPGDKDVPEFNIPYGDKLVHFTFYFVAAILGCLFLRERTNGGLKPGIAIIIIAISVIIYGTIIEVIQAVFTVDRTGDMNDALANCLGAFCGAVTIKLLFSGKRQLKWKI
ncbi:MAG: VanZ family protein [Eudoraea sp.]|nr:VanZ family protein [Eudoraea sp.]